MKIKYTLKFWWLKLFNLFFCLRHFAMVCLWRMQNFLVLSYRTIKLVIIQARDFHDYHEFGIVQTE